MVLGTREIKEYEEVAEVAGMLVKSVAEGWGGRIDFTDFLLLLKLGGEWKCVAKAYNQNSTTISK